MAISSLLLLQIWILIALFLWTVSVTWTCVTWNVTVNEMKNGGASLEISNATWSGYGNESGFWRNKRWKDVWWVKLDDLGWIYLQVSIVYNKCTGNKFTLYCIPQFWTHYTYHITQLMCNHSKEKQINQFGMLQTDVWDCSTRLSCVKGNLTHTQKPKGQKRPTV